VFDDPSYARLAIATTDRFRTASPYPHYVFDDFLPQEVAAGAARGVDLDDTAGWIAVDTEHNKRAYQHDESALPIVVRELLREFNSRQFLLFLETLTGIEGLIADPYFLGGGLHISRRGGFLNVHEDWNWHHKLQLERRLNVIVYLTEDWDPTWGGALELWTNDGAECVQTVAPLFNRTIVFATTGSMHGHPSPLLCPPNKGRVALNIYYYTAPPVGSRPDDPHFTRYTVQASPLARGLRDRYEATATAED
jgi:hypothetical protein